MAKYDEAKTKELLVNIGEKGIEISDISKLLCKNVVGVKLRGSRGKMSTSVSLQSCGLKDYAEIEDFTKSNINNASINFFDKEIIKKFDGLLNKVRQSMYKYAISNDGSIYYMTEKNYFQWKKKFDSVYMKDFENAKKDLKDNLADYKSKFATDLKTFTTTRGLDDVAADMLYNSIYNNFPTEVEIEKYCSMAYTLTAFPVFSEENIDGVNPSIASALIADKDTGAVDAFYDMVGNCLIKAFNMTIKCLDSIDISDESMKKGLVINMPSKTKGYLNDCIQQLIADNGVLRNDKLMQINKVISRTFRELKNKDGEDINNADAISVGETVIAEIYSYAKYLGVEDMLTESISKSDYTTDDLDAIAELCAIEEV